MAHKLRWYHSRNKQKQVVLIAAILLVGAGGAYLLIQSRAATTGPKTFISQAQIDAVKAKVQANAQPWKGAYDKMISEANTALNLANQSVTYNNHYGNTYCEEQAYYIGQDGVINPNAKREDYFAAFELAKALPKLGMAYQITGDDKYAQKAHQLIKVWAIDSATRMIPSTENPCVSGTNAGYGIFVTQSALIYGADLIWGYGGWTEAQRSSFTSWAKTLGTDAMTRWQGDKDIGNNIDNLRLMLTSSAGAFASDSTILNYTYDRFKSNVRWHIAADGLMTRELSRTKSLYYSMHSLMALTIVAELARNQGVDLYNYTTEKRTSTDTSGGRNLKLAYDKYVPYMLNPSTWPYRQDTALSSSDAAHFELAYGQWQDPDHLNVINKYVRPLTEIRVLQSVTLSHGNRFALNSLPVSRPDLVVTSMTANPANPTTGQAVTFSAVVTNQGNAATPAGTIIGVRFEVAGSMTWSDTHTTSLAPGASITLTANGGTAGNTWTPAAAGAVTVAAIVDDAARIAESNDTNNTLTKQVTVAQAATGQSDLVVTTVSLEILDKVFADEIFVTANDRVRFKATIKNNGSAASPAGTIHGVAFSVDGNKVTWSDTYVNSLAPGASVTLTANAGVSSATWLATAGTHDIEAWVDDANRIPNETNESNNKLTIGLQVEAMTKLGDLNGDNAVNIFDLSKLLVKFNKPGSAAEGDLNGDGQVNVSDMSVLLGRWGS